MVREQEFTFFISEVFLLYNYCFLITEGIYDQRRAHDEEKAAHRSGRNLGSAQPPPPRLWRFHGERPGEAAVHAHVMAS